MSIPRDHSHMKFSDGSRNKYMRVTRELWTSLYTQLTLCIYASTNGLSGGAKTDFAPGTGNHRYATVSRDGFRERGALGYVSGARCDLFGRLSGKRKSTPLLCIVHLQKSIFCGSDFGSTIALYLNIN